LIVEIVQGTSYGFLPKDAWDWLNSLRHKIVPTSSHTLRSKQKPDTSQVFVLIYSIIRSIFGLVE